MTQYEVAVRKGNQADLKILYNSPRGVVIISESSKNLTSSTNSILNTTQLNNTGTQTKPGKVVTIDTIKEFAPYENVFKGSYIL